MAISVDTPNTPGWWMQSLYKQLAAKQPELNRLDAYRSGRPPIILGSEATRTAFYRFQSVSRTNLADLIATAVTDRQAVRSLRTAAAADDNGDQDAWGIWTRNNLDVYSTDVHYDAASLGIGYVSIGLDGDQPVIVPEDPRQVIHAADELNPMLVKAGFKLFHDQIAQRDYAILWLPGQRWVAYRQRKAVIRDGQPVSLSFSPAAFTMAPFDAGSDLDEVNELNIPDLDEGYNGLQSQTYATSVVPLVPFQNRRGVGEFANHTDLIDRINHVMLQQVVIITLQAFKQRALLLDATLGEDGGLPDEDENGQKIDYNDMFKADPGALWLLPPGAKIWESTEVNLQSILAAAKDYIQQLASVTKTPFSMFSSDAVNQSAEGAQLTREQLVFKVEDRNKIFGRSWALVLAIAFAFAGDSQRAEPSTILVDWAPAERYSLQEKATADASAVSLSDEQKYRVIWGLTPAEARIAVAQKSAQDLREAALKLPVPQPPVVQPNDQPAA